MRLAEIAERMESEHQASIYVVAQSHALAQLELSGLSEDLPLDERWFGPGFDVGTLGLWLGPRDTVTPLHWDLTPTILAQVYGTKRVTLIAPEYSDKLYANGGYSEVDPDRPDALTSWPLLAHVELHVLTLRAGDAIFLPPRWWHHVRSLSASASVSIGRFACDVPAT